MKSGPVAMFPVTTSLSFGARFRSPTIEPSGAIRFASKLEKAPLVGAFLLHRMSDSPSVSSNVARHLRAAALALPDEAAVTWRAGHVPVADNEVAHHVVSFARLDRDSDACAAWLEALGVRPGMCVLLMVKPGL